MALTEGAATAPGRTVWNVAALLLAMGDALAARFAGCAVRGEIAGFSRASSGHCYFSLKDADGGNALIRCAMFRRAASLLDFAPADGQLVELRGRVAVYEPRGELQFVVEAMQRAGSGSLYEQFLRLKAKLEAQGLFDAARKRSLPSHPRAIGVVTSLAAAALRDVLTTLARRSPQVRVIVYPSPVQGVEAPDALVRALRLAGERREVDTLILCRGGGSLEDLWAFSDERVVRAVAGSPIPLVCGVGHETDFSLADLAADLRAPTPTAAAELAAPAAAQCHQVLGSLALRSHRRVQHALGMQAQRLDAMAARLARPADAMRRRVLQLDALEQRGHGALRHVLALRKAQLAHRGEALGRAGARARQREHDRLSTLEARLRALDPHRVLGRGFAWLTGPDGNVLHSVSQLAEGAEVDARLADGAARMTVREVLPPGAD